MGKRKRVALCVSDVLRARSPKSDNTYTRSHNNEPIASTEIPDKLDASVSGSAVIHRRVTYKEIPVKDKPNALGHTVDRCYKVHGYPPDLKSKDKIEQCGGEIDKMSMFVRSRDLDDPEVANIILEFNRRVIAFPEAERIIMVRDRIYHELLGVDGHGYCHTYGSGVIMSQVYPHETVSKSAHQQEIDSLKSSQKEMMEKFEEQILLLRQEIKSMRCGGCSGSDKVNEESRPSPTT